MCTGTSSYKKWVKNSIVLLMSIVFSIVILNIIVDPYFHFHKPITKYRLNEERYINDGIARHFEYDAIITGNSLTENFKTSQFDELFGTNSVKLPYSGSGYKDIWKAIDLALKRNPKVKKVLVGFDLEDICRNHYWQRYDYMPEYLYDDNVFNDVNYVLNKEILYRGTIYNILWTLAGKNSTSFDEYASWERQTGIKEACASLDTIVEKYEWDIRAFNEEDIEKVDGNIRKNVIPVIEANPEVEFVLVIPPSSIAKWAEYYNKGQVEYRIAGLEYALPILLKYDNIKLYGFDDAFEVTENLELYCDTIHYDESINEWMLDEINAGNHRLTFDGYQGYVNIIRERYVNYDYFQLNEFIK